MSPRERLDAQKSALRSDMLRALRAMTAVDRAACSEAICRRVIESEQWRKAERVLLFSPLRTEPDITPLLTTQSDLKSVATIPSTLRHEDELDLPFVPDFVLVPGLAFSRNGYRLGRGGGFYDRLLAGRARDAVKVGVGFELQLTDDIPRAEHDVILDRVITD